MTSVTAAPCFMGDLGACPRGTPCAGQGGLAGATSAHGPPLGPDLLPSAGLTAGPTGSALLLGRI